MVMSADGLPLHRHLPPAPPLRLSSAVLDPLAWPPPLRPSPALAADPFVRLSPPVLLSRLPSWDPFAAPAILA